MSPWEMIRPILLLAAFCFWVWCLVDALQGRRPWRWVVLLAFLPFVSAPFYYLNFRLSRRREGAIDSAVAEAGELRRLQEQAREAPTAAVLEKLAEALAARGRWKEALDAVGKALESDDESIPAQFLAGRCLAELGKPANAAAHLAFVVEREPRHRGGAARTLLAISLAAMGREQEGRVHLERAAREDHLPEAVVRLAQALADEGNPAAARELLSHLLEREDHMTRDTRDQHQRWLKAARDLAKSIPA